MLFYIIASKLVYLIFDMIEFDLMTTLCRLLKRVHIQHLQATRWREQGLLLASRCGDFVGCKAQWGPKWALWTKAYSLTSQLQHQEMVLGAPGGGLVVVVCNSEYRTTLQALDLPTWARFQLQSIWEQRKKGINLVRRYRVLLDLALALVYYWCWLYWAVYLWSWVTKGRAAWLYIFVNGHLDVNVVALFYVVMLTPYFDGMVIHLDGRTFWWQDVGWGF